MWQGALATSLQEHRPEQHIWRKLVVQAEQAGRPARIVASLRASLGPKRDPQHFRLPAGRLLRVQLRAVAPRQGLRDQVRVRVGRHDQARQQHLPRTQPRARAGHLHHLRAHQVE